MNYITFFIILAVAAVINAYGSAFSTAVDYWKNKWFNQLFADFVKQRMAEGMTEEEAQQLAASHKFDHTTEVFQITGQLEKSKGCAGFLCLAFALSVSIGITVLAQKCPYFSSGFPSCQPVLEEGVWL